MRSFATLLAFCIACTASPAFANVQTGGLTTTWSTVAYLTLTVTPNYASGFGTVKAVTGAQPAPAPGGGATFQGGAIDFGSVYAGADYLYKYAAHVNVGSNAAHFNLYAEGSADFTGTGAAAGSTMPINQSIYWLPSTDGVSQSDPNTGFSAATPFRKTTQGGAAYNNPTIAYGAYPAPVYTSPVGSADLYYDFQLKLPSAPTLGPYFVYVVYTAVPF